MSQDILKIVKTKSELLEAIDILKKSDDCTIGADTETSHLRPHLGYIVGHCLAAKVNGVFYGFYIPVRHDTGNVEEMLAEDVEKILNDKIYWDTNYKKVFWNMKFDLNFYRRHNISCLHNDDAMIACFLRDEREKNHQLKYLSSKYIDKSSADEQKEVKAAHQKLGGWEGGAHYGMLPVHLLGKYGAKDPVLTLKLWYMRGTKHVIQPEESGKKDGLRYDIYAHELEFTEIVMDMEYRGVPYDLEVAENIWIKVRDALKKTEDYIFELVGERFNIDSNAQVNGILVDKMRYAPVKTSPRTGEPSWGRAELLKLGDELGECIAAYRNLSHSLALFDEGLKKYVHDGIVRCYYNQIGTKTGRASCAEPNLQQIAKRLPRYTRIPVFTYDGIRAAFRIRQAFRAPEGYKIVSIDESQFELRLLQHYAQDAGLADAFNNGLDVHTYVAANVFDVDYGAIVQGIANKSDEFVRYRTVGKEIDFAVVYGAGDPRLLQTIQEYGFDYTLNEVKEFRRKYYARFSGIKKFIDLIQSTVRRRGWLFNHYGRHRRIDADKAYTGVNHLIQGVTADMLKDTAKSCTAILERTPESYLGMMIHDENLFLMKDEHLELIPQLKAAMEDFPWVRCPIKAEVSLGQSWGEQEAYDGEKIQD